MTIELAASNLALTNIDLTDLDSIEPDRLTTAWVGVDLSILGAAVDCLSDSDLPVDRLNFPRLASSANAAFKGGLDFVTLGKRFQTRSDRQVRDGSLDGAKTLAKLADFSKGGVFVEVPATADHINQAIDLVAAQSEGWAGVSFEVDTDTDLASLAESVTSARSAGINAQIIATAAVAQERAAEIAELADTVRLKTNDPHAARSARFALRAASHELSRDLLVFAELGIVISASLQAAEERALLISEINACPLFADLHSIIGTVYDVADAIESWIGLGAADGVILLPASLPTDLASILKGVLPLLKARSVIEEDE